MTIRARKACTADHWNHFKKDDDCKTSMCPTRFLDAVRWKDGFAICGCPERLDISGLQYTSGAGRGRF